MNDRPQSAGRPTALISFFSSIRLTVVLLLTLAATSIIGTVIPQNQNPSLYLVTYGEFIYRLFSVLDFFDMYHSWWFQLLLVLLSINIVVCSVERLSATWKIIFPEKSSLRPERFRKASNRIEGCLPGKPEDYREDVRKAFSRLMGSAEPVSVEGGYYLLAEKGRWTRLGVYVVHLSVLFLLIGGLIGSIWGFDGYVNIPEGEKTDTIQLTGKGKVHQLDFAIRCDRFSIQFYESGAPSEYRSTLTILRQGTPLMTRDIIVNDPLEFEGINFYQSSYSQVPSREVVLSFLSRESGMEYREEAGIGKTLVLPEGMGSFSLTNFGTGFRFRGRDIGEAFVGEWKSPAGEVVEIVLPVKFPQFDRMRKGDVIVSIADMKTRYATGLQVVYDPGVWIVYVGFLFMIAGCVISFFMAHRQVWVEVVAGQGASSKATVVSISGISTKNKLGLETALMRMMQEITSQPPTRSQDSP
jgi:cytochrome c biogenesis protein